MAEPDDEAEYLYQVIKYKIRDEWLNKLTQKYSGPVRLSVPAEWPKIKEALSWVYDIPGVIKIVLTGSLLIHDIKTFKDYDIVILFDSFESSVDFENNQKHRLPRELDGVEMDYFFLTSMNDMYFAILDPDKLEVHPSRWATLDVQESEGLTILPYEPTVMAETIWRRVQNNARPQVALNQWESKRLNTLTPEQTTLLASRKETCKDCGQHNGFWADMVKCTPCGCGAMVLSEPLTRCPLRKHD